MTLKEFVEDNVQISNIKCALCQSEITETHPDEFYRVKNKPICNDCYFEALGSLIEDYPIVHPRIHRG